MKDKIRGVFKNETFYKVLLFATILAVSYAIILRPILDYDYWFHMVSGNYFLETGKVPTTAINSWWGIAQDLQWISHEWLFGVFINTLTRLISQKWIPDFVALFLGVLVALCACNNVQKLKSNFIVVFGSLLLVVYSLSLGYAPRPHLFAYLFTILMTMILIKDGEQRECKWIYLCIPLMILWVNFHGGSYILLPAFLLADLFCNNFDFELGKISFELGSSKQQIRRLITLIACIACIPLNGHGFAMILYPITNMTDTLMQSSISEWISPNFKQLRMMIPLALMLFAYCAMISTKKKVKPMDLILCGVFTYLFLRSQRFAPQAAPIFFLIGVQYMDALDFVPKLHRKSQLILLTAILITSVLIGKQKRQSTKEPFNLKYFPTDETIELVQDINPKRVFNQYNDGGYLMYKGIDVFIDGRADIYSRSNFEDYLSIVGCKSNTLELLETYDFDILLINHDSVLARLLDLSKDYECIHIDDHGKAIYKQNK